MLTLRASNQVSLEVLVSLGGFKTREFICSLQPPFLCLDFFHVLPTKELPLASFKWAIKAAAGFRPCFDSVGQHHSLG